MSEPKKNHTGLIVGAVVGIGVLAGLAIVILLAAGGALLYLNTPDAVLTEPIASERSVDLPSDDVVADVEDGTDGEEGADDAPAEEEAAPAPASAPSPAPAPAPSPRPTPRPTASPSPQPAPAPAPAPAPVGEEHIEEVAPVEEVVEPIDETLTADLVSVQISSQPTGAEVLMDGAAVGKTPVTTKVEAGSHRIRLDSGKAFGSFTIEAGGPQTAWCYEIKGAKIRVIGC